MLRDRIVCGIRSGALQKQLLAQRELTLQDAEAMALAAEAADSDVKEMIGPATTPVLKVQAYRTETLVDERRAATRQECARCGSTKHNDACCSWSNARCYRCGRRGHLARKCRSRGAREQGTARTAQTNTLLGTEASADKESEATHIWTLVSQRKSCLEPPIRRTFDWCGVQLSMEVDTGSPVCVIPRELYYKHREQWPKLKPSSLNLSCYTGRLPVLGELALQVCHKGVTVECALTVLDCAGPSLCGRDLIQRLNSAGAPVVSFVENSAATNDSSESSVNSIFNDYNDVFSEELGLIKGPPASLHMKEGAVPKFCKARPITYALRERVSLELDRLVSVGVLSPVAHSEWATPIVVVLKKDGAPLLGLLKSDKQTPTMAAARIQRWALHLGAYRYRLQYAPGRQMLNADALSRLPQRSSESDDDGEPPEYVLSLNQLNNGTITTRPKEDQDDWLPLPASEVYTRNYGVGSKWTPGHVKATSGARMVTVETSDGVIQRHVDQVRPRQEVPGVKPTVTTTTTHRSEPDQATQLQHPETVNPDEGITARRIPNGTRSPDFAAPDIPVAPLHTGVAQQTLRRSTRERKPVQRFHFRGGRNVAT
ncbi:uncharacterized protein LOC142590786 [Dermacentor variabilis]|uniref:uncharacterized protein LOC142590786 n=1 Tax=Dermacentor variabilis TaxID=34621 RepID=UPI003F5BB665